MSFFDLPSEDVIFLKILPLVSLKDNFNLRRVSDDFATLIDNYFLFLKIVSNNDALALDRTELEELAEKTGNVEVLHLGSCKLLNNEIIKKFLYNNKRTLTHVNVADTKIDVRAFHGIIHCKRLRQLVIRNNLWVCSPFLMTIVQHLKSLLYVDINECNQLDWKVTLCNLWFTIPELKCVRSQGQLFYMNTNPKRCSENHDGDGPPFSPIVNPSSRMLKEGWLLDKKL